MEGISAEVYQRALETIPYPVTPERLAAAKTVIRQRLGVLGHDLTAAVIIELGLGDCIGWSGDRIQFHASNLQLCAIAGTLASIVPRSSSDPPYYDILPGRCEASALVLQTKCPQLGRDDIAGIFGEVGLWDSIVWQDVAYGIYELDLTDLSTCTAAAAIAAGLDGLENGPIRLSTISAL